MCSTRRWGGGRERGREAGEGKGASGGDKGRGRRGDGGKKRIEARKKKTNNASKRGDGCRLGRGGSGGGCRRAPAKILSLSLSRSR